MNASSASPNPKDRAAPDAVRVGLSLIVARARGGVIGIAGKLPWHLPEDLRWFREHTLGHTVIMGRKTFESIGKPLPKRENIVVSRNLAFRAEGCTIVGSLDDALRSAASEPQPFVIGGEALYGEALPLASYLYITEIDKTYDGDAFFRAEGEQAFGEVFTRPSETPGVRFRILARRHSSGAPSSA
jgi:dihydrofolate reductase